MILCRHCKKTVPTQEYFAVHCNGGCTRVSNDNTGDENKSQLKCPCCGLERSYTIDILKNCPTCGTEFEVAKNR